MVCATIQNPAEVKRDCSARTGRTEGTVKRPLVVQTDLTKVYLFCYGTASESGNRSAKPLVRDA